MYLIFWASGHDPYNDSGIYHDHTPSDTGNDGYHYHDHDNGGGIYHDHPQYDTGTNYYMCLVSWDTFKHNDQSRPFGMASDFDRFNGIGVNSI